MSQTVCLVLAADLEHVVVHEPQLRIAQRVEDVLGRQRNNAFPHETGIRLPRSALV